MVTTEFRQKNQQMLKIVNKYIIENRIIYTASELSPQKIHITNTANSSGTWETF